MIQTLIAVIVALFMGAWIEMKYDKFVGLENSWSHSSWVRGLKLSVRPLLHGRGIVALFMGAWIEIIQTEQGIFEPEVALFMGAWIEMP